MLYEVITLAGRDDAAVDADGRPERIDQDRDRRSKAFKDAAYFNSAGFQHVTPVARRRPIDAPGCVGDDAIIGDGGYYRVVDPDD